MSLLCYFVASAIHLVSCEPPSSGDSRPVGRLQSDPMVIPNLYTSRKVFFTEENETFLSSSIVTCTNCGFLFITYSPVSRISCFDGDSLKIRKGCRVILQGYNVGVFDHCAEWFCGLCPERMAGGGIAVGVAGARATQYEAKITPAVILICLIAASGGLLFGYDLGEPSILPLFEFIFKLMCRWKPC